MARGKRYTKGSGHDHYLGIDTETGGLNPRNNALLEIGAVPLNAQFEPREDVQPFRSLVRPYARTVPGSRNYEDPATVTAQAVAINKLTWALDPHCAEYKKAPAEGEVLVNFLYWLRRIYLPQAERGLDKNGNLPELPLIIPVGWNVSFDEGFLQAWFKRCERTADYPLHYHKVDLQSVCRYLDARAGRVRRSYRLEAMAEYYFGESAKFAMHSAMGDAQMQVRVLRAVENDVGSPAP